MTASISVIGIMGPLVLVFLVIVTVQLPFALASCPAGTFSPDGGGSGCTSCPAGSYSTGPSLDPTVASFNSYLNSLPNLLTLVNAYDGTQAGLTAGIVDLTGGGMTWDIEDEAVTFGFESGIPCWDLNNGNFITTTRKSLGGDYTLFYKWKPRLSDDGCRTLHRGDNDHWTITNCETKNLGVYSNRFDGFSESSGS